MVSVPFISRFETVLNRPIFDCSTPLLPVSDILPTRNKNFFAIFLHKKRALLDEEQRSGFRTWYSDPVFGSLLRPQEPLRDHAVQEEHQNRG